MDEINWAKCREMNFVSLEVTIKTTMRLLRNNRRPGDLDHHISKWNRICIWYKGINDESVKRYGLADSIQLYFFGVGNELNGIPKPVYNFTCAHLLSCTLKVL